MASTTVRQLEAVMDAATPIIGIETLDQQGLVLQILQHLAETDQENKTDTPVVQWDMVRGAKPLTESAKALVTKLCQTEDGPVDPTIATGNPTEFLARLLGVEKHIFIMFNVHRIIDNESVSQAIANLRDVFKSSESHLILLAPYFKLPDELKQDVLILTENLPEHAELIKVVESICADAEIKKPKDIGKIADTLTGLSLFSAEQTLATSLEINEKNELVINRKTLWERKCKTIEQTPGLSIYRGSERFKDIGGCDNVKTFLLSILNGDNAPLAIIFMDEIEKAFAGAGTDTSGVSQDQLGVILSFMQDNEVDGMIFIGPPGAAKSAVAKAAGNEVIIPTVIFDLGAMKNSLVGKSGEQTRQALKVILSISKGRMLFIATCNSIGVLPPELKRRFTMGTFFFDLPTQNERELIWNIYMKKYNICKQEIPNDTGWTGAEIKQSCRLAKNLKISLKETTSYIVPVAVSDGDKIEKLRSQATGKFISASNKGVYSGSVVDTTKSARKFRLTGNN